jgi:flagellar hook protein FlgE
MKIMLKLSTIAASGLQAAQTQLTASASNIANAQTAGYTRQAAALQAQPGGGVLARLVPVATTSGPTLEADMVAQLQAKNAFMANLAVFKTQDKLAGSLLSLKA